MRRVGLDHLFGPSRLIFGLDCDDFEYVVPAQQERRVYCDNETMLMNAIRSGDQRAAMCLITNGTNLNVRNREGSTPLILACREKQHILAQLLVVHGARLDAQDMKGQTALMLLCQDGESKTARLLVQYGATLEIQDSKGWTALIHAIKNENDEVARMLLQQKGNVDIQTKAGCTALQCACDHGQPALVRQLIDDGANVDHQEASGVTSLMFACYRGEQGIARLLISNGANVNLRTNDARTALLLACEEKQHNIAELLVNHGAYLDAQDPEGRTALMIACGDRVSKVARLLIKCGADLEVQDRKGWTALIHAIKNGNVETARTLIEKGEKLNAKTEKGFTALHFACDSRQSVLVRQLISGGANVNYQQLRGMTSLMVACLRGEAEAARMLIENGANVKIRDKNARTALLFACQAQSSPYMKSDGPLRCVKLCWAEGAEIAGYHSARSMASCHEKTDILAFFDFVEKSKVGKALLNELCQPRHVVVRFFENNFVVPKRCKALDDKTLARMGVICPKQRSKILERLNPATQTCASALGSATPPQAPSASSSTFAEQHQSSEAGSLDDLRSFFDTQTSQQTSASSTSTSLPSEEQPLAPPLFSTSPMDLGGQLKAPADQSTPPMQEPSGNSSPPSQTPSCEQEQELCALPPTQTPSCKQNKKLFDAFLTHNWGKDGVNHELVRDVNKSLCDADLKTWFDGDRLSGNIRQEIAHGLENTEKVVVFITREYMEKLKSKGSDYCKEEFQAAEKVVGQENLIPVILESSMLDKSSWRGPLVLVLGDYLHVDFTTPEKREENMEYLVKRIQARVSN